MYFSLPFRGQPAAR